MEHGMFTRKNMVGEWDNDLEKIIDLDDFFQDAMISKRNLVGDFFKNMFVHILGIMIPTD